ncbi:Hypothetical protein, putative [Bodo saltans]|uniref:Uncharacterized protein n=1 Tax=Bodo saltans TaxID=75058 RepID=A0A0S4KLX6_BODSA|nr:Hypothetical protein, putative [Bodo saltans]|eukprot:CUI15372.1 Hypothetical protein, putative [Bodo saltans]
MPAREAAATLLAVSDRGAAAAAAAVAGIPGGGSELIKNHNAEMGGVRDGIVVVFTNEKGFKELPLHIRSKIDLAVFVVNRPMPAREAAAALLGVSDGGAAADAVAGIPGGGSELIKSTIQSVVSSCPRGQTPLLLPSGSAPVAAGCPVLFAVDPRIRSDELERWCAQQAGWTISTKDTSRTTPHTAAAAVTSTPPISSTDGEMLPSVDF